MAVNVRFMMKHCFPVKAAPVDKGYSAIQQHYKHLKISMKDILFELATSYILVNPIRGVMPESLFCAHTQTESEDVINKKIEARNSQWLKTATKYV